VVENRRALLVGSLPGASAAEAMRQAADRLGPDLDYLPDGETGDRRNWILGAVEGFREHPDLRLVKDGDWSDYDRAPRFAVRSGHRLYGATIDLGIAAAARAARPEFEALSPVLAGTGAAGTGPRLQVGIPGDLDMAMFTLGPAGVLRHLRPFTEALVATMHQVQAEAGPALFQFEMPAELVLLARAPARLRPGLAAVLARRVVALAQGTPAGAEVGLHLCLGDMNHRALGHVTDAEPLVLLANALAARWPERVPLRYVHLPLAAAEEPPVTDRAFYQPLSRLRLGAGTRLVAGFAHEGQAMADQVRVRTMIEDAVGHPVDISTSCGLGRREPTAGLAAMDRIKALLADAPAG
jgi:hypothetical protein